MIDTLSPFTRRFVALAALVLTVLLGVSFVIAPTLEMMQNSLDALATSTERLARTEALASRPGAPSGARVTRALAFVADDRAKGQTALVDLARASAENAHVTDIVLAPIASPSDQLVEAQVTATAPSAMILEFISRMERAEPLVRFKSWRLITTDPTGKMLRFEAIAVAAWKPR